MERYRTTIGEKTYTIGIESPTTVDIDGVQHEVNIALNQASAGKLMLDGKYYYVACRRISETHVDVWINNHILTVQLEDPRAGLLAQLNRFAATSHRPVTIKAPMPGLVIAVEVQVGDVVEPGRGLIILEAMKMENEIRSTVRGKVSSIKVSSRVAVEKDQPLIVLEPIAVK